LTTWNEITQEITLPPLEIRRAWRTVRSEYCKEEGVIKLLEESMLAVDLLLFASTVRDETK
jgi:hypothetical protein